MIWGLQGGLIAAKLDGHLDGSWSNILIPTFLALIVLVIALAGSTLTLLGSFCPMMSRLSTLTRSQRIIAFTLLLILALVWAWVGCLFHSFEGQYALLLWLPLLLPSATLQVHAYKARDSAAAECCKNHAPVLLLA
jgi:ABC-type Na+ efflux pump permease subunit